MYCSLYVTLCLGEFAGIRIRIQNNWIWIRLLATKGWKRWVQNSQFFHGDYRLRIPNRLVASELSVPSNLITVIQSRESRIWNLFLWLCLFLRMCMNWKNNSSMNSLLSWKIRIWIWISFLSKRFWFVHIFKSLFS